MLACRRFAILAPALLLAAGCVSGNKIRAQSEIISADIQQAKKAGAMRCAPRELALAVSNLDFANGEVAEGNSVRAQDHIKVAEENAKKALYIAKTKDCGPKQVLIKEKKEEKPLIVKVEATDKDGDGVFDAEDECPEVPGPKENKGCPVVKDTDGDGIPDDLDRCPLDPEDKDQFQDEDGCPDPDNDQDGITDQADGCPNEPGPVENKGCPIKDKDGDGIMDHEDKCPDEPEDKDQFEDEDGCPDLDNDKDTIPDAQDACPNEPGIAQDDPKKNGCPRKLSMVVVKKDRIEIKQQINFEFGKAKIKGKRSFEILNQVVTVLNDFPQIKKIKIEGHTDSVGRAASNQKLSEKRAEAVLEYLISRGVDASRLESEGFGPTKPIASNATAKGRALNRRTEFNIVERD